MKESELEDILAKYPQLIEEGLVLEGRQIVIHGRRMDLVFRDTFKRQLIVELKAGAIKDEHIGQIMSYEGSMLSSSNPDLRIMLVGTRVPQNIRNSLDHHGIAWKEISIVALIQYLEGVGNEELLKCFLNEEPTEKIIPRSFVKSQVVIPVTAADQVVVDVPAMLIRISKTYREGMSNEELFEVTRGIWKLGSKREQAQYGFAVVKGIIKEVYRIDRWLPGGTLEYRHRPDANQLKGRTERWEFDGVVAEDVIRDRFVGKSCAQYFKWGNISPTTYVNCG